MNPAGGHNSIAHLDGAYEAMMELCGPFAPPGAFTPEFEVIRPDAIPAPVDAMLVHQNHMTIELQRRHGKPVDVHVLDERLNDELYTRKITLTLAGTSRVVEWGICRLDLRCVSPEVREEILSRKIPLGAILIKHQVHRVIKPQFYARFPGSSSVIALFGASNPAPVYGRLGTIYCDGEPAIDLLEIVTGIQVEMTPQMDTDGHR